MSPRIPSWQLKSLDCPTWPGVPALPFTLKRRAKVVEPVDNSDSAGLLPCEGRGAMWPADRQNTPALDGQMTSGVSYVAATVADAASIAALHADSWRRHYRHSYPESFFGDTLDDERLAVWSDRLRDPTDTYTLLAKKGGELVGFVHVVIGGDADWGALVDNLHVRHDFHRHGVASQLMKQAAAFVATAAPGAGLYLWVLERNAQAQAFYRSIGGTFADQRRVEPPALPGSLCYRCVWSDPNSLV